MFTQGRDSVVESRLGRTDWNFEDGRGFFDREVVLVAKQEDGSAGRRNVIEEGKESFVG